MNEYSLPKTKTPVSPSEVFQKWIKKKMMEKKFASVSHAVEYALEELRKKGLNTLIGGLASGLLCNQVLRSHQAADMNFLIG